MTHNGPAIASSSHAPLSRHNYSHTCWWCGAPADSREHRYKASDLRREFEAAEYKAGDVIRWLGSGQEVVLRGPNAGSVKFSTTLCAACNNTRSQPFDRAYDVFIKWFLANEQRVEQTGIVPLHEIFTNYPTGSVDVLRYFGKHVGCRIAEKGFKVPETLRAFLDRGDEPRGFVFSLEISGDLAAVSADMRERPENGTGFLGFGPVQTKLIESDGSADEITSWWSYHGLQLIWQWKTEYPRSWTNLRGPVAVLPVDEPRQR